MLLPKKASNIKCQKEEKEFVTAGEEIKFWEMNLLGESAAMSLLYAVYFYSVFVQLTSLFNAEFHEETALFSQRRHRKIRK